MNYFFSLLRKRDKKEVDAAFNEVGNRDKIIT